MPTSRRDAAGLPLLAAYVGSVVLANYLTSHYGAWRVGFGLTATAGTYAIGGAIATRNLVQDAYGRVVVVAAITVAAFVSWLVGSGRVAWASGLTFLLSELLELAVYTPLRGRARTGDRRWAGAALAASVVGAVVDTFLFLRLAGFPTDTRGVEGQLVGKGWVVLAVIAATMLARLVAVPREPLRA